MSDAAPEAVREGEVVPAQAGVAAFSFGDPEPVLNRRELLEHLECWHNGRYYDPPVSLAGLARAFRVSPHHSSAIIIKRNLLAATFEPTPYLTRDAFSKLVLDYLVLGNAYLERKRNRLGQALRLEHALGKYVRRGIEADRFFFVPDFQTEFEFERGSVCHLLEPDINQEIYGVPEYLSALQSALLNEAATLFRRRYYLNGSHAGFILYMSDPSQSQEDIDALRQALKDSKGPGNFRNLFLYSPSGKKDGVQVIPVSEIAAKDEFLGIKNTTRDDILAAHRVPPQLLGVVPANAGGFGDVAKADEVFFRNEIEPLQARFLAVNDWLGAEAVRFKPREVAAA